MPRNRDADRVEADRLIAMLRVQVASINEVAESEDDPQALGEMVHLATDLAFAADLLGAYAAGLALANPDPITGAHLVERISPNEGLPDVEETVLVWSDESSEQPWLGWFDGLAWWYVDSAPIRRIDSWAYRPGRPA